VDCMVDLFGVPPDHLLCAGMYSKVYFVQDPAGHWRLKTRAEFWDNNILSYGRKLYHYHSLDEVEHLDLVDMREVEVKEKKMCIDLLKGMLQLDANVRLTPDEVLAHPFITWSDQQYTSCHESLNDSSSQLSEPRTSETPELNSIGFTESVLTLIGELDTSDLETIEDSESELSELSDLDTSDLESIEDTESELTEISELDTSDLETITVTESWTSQAAEAWCSLFLRYSHGTHESSTHQADEEGKVRSAPPKSCVPWYEDVRHPRETCRQRQLSLPLLPCKIYQEDTATTSDDKEPQQNKKKKGFKRFCSLMRRMFCCCIRVEGNEG
ncbi:homeodomain-interacting protein kinase 1-like, partial [Scomber scombrus]